jgi:hypothetical protein
MKKFLISIAIFASFSTSLLAAIYSPENADCTKTDAYVANLVKSDFHDLLDFDDPLQNVTYHFFYNSNRKIDVILVSTHDNKICLLATGVNTRMNITESKPENFRDFFDSAVRNALEK